MQLILPSIILVRFILTGRYWHMIQYERAVGFNLELGNMGLQNGAKPRNRKYKYMHMFDPLSVSYLDWINFT